MQVKNGLHGICYDHSHVTAKKAVLDMLFCTLGELTNTQMIDFIRVPSNQDHCVTTVAIRIPICNGVNPADLWSQMKLVVTDEFLDSSLT